MADEIRADYDQLEQVASQFVNEAQAIQAMQQKVRSSYAKLVDKGWIGQGATAFFDEMDSKVLPTQEHLQQALEQAGQITQKIAQAIRQAEEQASSLFRN
jgi:WXG100 family type VII secretion target